MNPPPPPPIVSTRTLIGMAIITVALVAYTAIQVRNVSTPPPSSRVTIESTPSGASVFLDGRFAGRTPLVVLDLKSGGHGLRLEKNPYDSVAESIQVKAGEQSMSFTLPPLQSGELAVDVKPVGAEVFLDGVSIGYTPLRRNDVPAGNYALLIRKTNFKDYSARVEITPGKAKEYTDFALEDRILEMLRRTIDADPQSVSAYMDLGHYMFVNQNLEESARLYAQALFIASQPLQFGAEVNADERRADTQRRAEDVNRLNDEIRKKSHWPGKDVKVFRDVLAKAQEDVADKNVMEWTWVKEQADNFVRDGKLDRAQLLYQKHIAASKATINLPQAYIALMTLRIRMRNMDGTRETFRDFEEKFGGRPEVTRQAANAIYTSASNFEAKDRDELLGMAEKLLRRAVASTPRKQNPELNALCKFELGNVLALKGQHELAIGNYKDAVEGTADQSTKELRTEKWIDSLRAKERNEEARKLLTDLTTSPREHIATKAKTALKELEAAVPSPDQVKK